MKSLVGARMFNVRDHWLRAIKHIQNEFFCGLDVIMSCEFYQAPHVKDYWIFYSFNDSISALTPNIWKNNVKCDELTLVMWQIDTKNLNKIFTCT